MSRHAPSDHDLSAPRPTTNVAPDAGAEVSRTRRDFLKILGLGAVAVATATDEPANRYNLELARQSELHTRRARPLPVLSAAAETLGREKLRIVPDLPTFSRLRDLGVYDHPYLFTPRPTTKDEAQSEFVDLKSRFAAGRDSIIGVDRDSVKYAITASSEALTAIGRQFAELPRTAELLRKEEVRVLCPAAGVLLSPLEIAFQLAERSSVLQRVHFTSTEIDTDTYAVIDSYLRRTVDACINTTNLAVTEETHPATVVPAEQHGSERAVGTRLLPHKKKHMEFTYTTASGRAVVMVIDFELNLSGQHYFNAAAANQADIILMHDLDRTSHDGEFPQTKAAGDIYTLFADTATSGFGAQPHFCVMTQEHCGFHEGAESYVTAAVGTVLSTVRGKRFGCGENHQDHNHPLSLGNIEDSWANIVELDSGLMMTLHRHGGDAFIRGYTLLANPDALSQAMSFDHEGSTRLLLQNFVAKLQTLREPRIRRVIRQVAAEAMAHLGTSEGRSRRTFFQSVIQAVQ